jgi:photosystem II stability/assembly factor-like uncharacterized protein
MKSIFVVAVLIALVVLGLMGCSPIVAPTDSILPPHPISGAQATSASFQNSGPWKVIRQSVYEQSAYQAGFLDDSFGIMVGYDGAVNYTDNGGQTWSKGNNTSYCRFGLDIVDRQTAWNCGNGGHVRMSTDGGKNWQAVANFGSSEPDQCRFLSFLDTRIGWAAAPQVLGATTDGGSTWNTLTLPKGIKDVAAIALRTTTEGYLVDTTGTVFVTNDSGQTWTTRSLGLTENEKLTIAKAPTAAIRFTDAQNGMVVFALKEGVFSTRTADGGRTWKRERVGIDYKTPTLYLAHDGQTLTAIDGLFNLMVLRYQIS